jgi:hypothetical protein
MLFLRDCDQLDEVLLIRLSEAQTRYQEKPTPDNKAAYNQAFTTFADWILRHQLPEDLNEIKARQVQLLWHDGRISPNQILNCSPSGLGVRFPMLGSLHKQ